MDDTTPGNSAPMQIDAIDINFDLLDELFRAADLEQRALRDSKVLPVRSYPAARTLRCDRRKSAVTIALRRLRSSQ